jgi:hypothetical protein
MRAVFNRENPGSAVTRLGQKNFRSWLAQMSYSTETPPCKAFETTLPSTLDWRDFWRVHGTSWRSLIDLHFQICDRLRATSSSWCAP